MFFLLLINLFHKVKFGFFQVSSQMTYVPGSYNWVSCLLADILVLEKWSTITWLTVMVGTPSCQVIYCVSKHTGLSLRSVR